MKLFECDIETISLFRVFCFPFLKKNHLKKFISGFVESLFILVKHLGDIIIVSYEIKITMVNFGGTSLMTVMWLKSKWTTRKSLKLNVMVVNICQKSLIHSSNAWVIENKNVGGMLLCSFTHDWIILRMKIPASWKKWLCYLFQVGTACLKMCFIINCVHCIIEF